MPERIFSDHTDQKLKIIIVEDHQPNRLLLLRQLTYLGHQVDASSNGWEALEAIRNSYYDVVITDCNMPTMNGYELTVAIREAEKSQLGPKLYIIGFTANATEEEVNYCLSIGMNDCLLKPVTLEIISASLMRVLLQHDQLGRSSSISVSGTSSPYIDIGFLTAQVPFQHGFARELLSALYDCNERDIELLEEAIESCNYEAVDKIIHRLKGGACVAAANNLSSCIKNYELSVEANSDKSNITIEAYKVCEIAKQTQIAIKHLLLNDS